MFNLVKDDFDDNMEDIMNFIKKVKGCHIKILTRHKFLYISAHKTALKTCIFSPYLCRYI